MCRMGYLIVLIFLLFIYTTPSPNTFCAIINQGRSKGDDDDFIRETSNARTRRLSRKMSIDHLIMNLWFEWAAGGSQNNLSAHVLNAFVYANGSWTHCGALFSVYKTTFSFSHAQTRLRVPFPWQRRQQSRFRGSLRVHVLNIAVHPHTSPHSCCITIDTSHTSRPTQPRADFRELF